MVFTCPSIFSCVEDRSGERLVQGLLRFALCADDGFRNAVCEWLGWSPCTQVDEEIVDAAHRHDLVMTLEDGGSKAIELKLWAGWTHAQETSPESIDIVLVPAARRKRAERLFPADRVKTWEELLSIAKGSPLASRILRGLGEYGWLGDTLSAHVATAELQEREDRAPVTAQRIDSFLSRCSDHVVDLGLASTHSFSIPGHHGFWGRYLKNSRFGYFEDWLWTGFVFTRSAEGKLTKHDFVLAAWHRGLADRLQLRERIVEWFPWESPLYGITIPSGERDEYDVDDWAERVDSIVRAYASLTP